MNRLLLVEDDLSITGPLTAFLQSEGFQVDAVPGQAEALKRLEGQAYDLILLDVMLQNGNGFSLCTTVKSAYQIPIIFLTASGDEGSVVSGLDLGADDYIVKPFRPRELVSRIRGALRRSGGARSVVQLGDVQVDADRAVVTKGGREVALSALEYKLLSLFLSNRGRLLTRQALLEEIWDVGGDFVNDNTLTVYIKRLREKIEDDPSHPALIKTVRGLGYRVD